jgi:hypothetical protein
VVRLGELRGDGAMMGTPFIRVAKKGVSSVKSDESAQTISWRAMRRMQMGYRVFQAWMSPRIERYRTGQEAGVFIHDGTRED